MLDDTRLRIFLLAAQTGNFSRTAREMRLTQPAVSQNISDIEKTYGIRLFDRTRGAAVLTPEGEVFRNIASHIIDSYDELEIIFRNFSQLKEVEEISIAASESCFAWTTSSLLPYIYKVCPGASVALSLLPDDSPSGTGTDLCIYRKDGVRSVEPSAAFADSVLYKLISLQ